MKKITITTSVAIIIGSIIISAAVLFANSLSSKGVTNSKNFVDPDSMFAGRAFKKEEFLVGGDDKKVVLVEYSDMECPFCKKLHVEVSNQIYKNYGDKLGVVFRHFPLPFHKKAKQEALATLCAREIGGQAAYRNYIEKVYEKTQGNDTLNLDILPIIATEIGLDTNAFKVCMTNASSTSSKMAMIEADAQDGQLAGVEGTPNIFVLIKEGSEYRKLTVINGARDYKYISKVIDQALRQ